jgi:hypothetical protein
VEAHVEQNGYRDRVISVLFRFLTVERDGVELYRHALTHASGAAYDMLFDFGVEADRHVRLLEAALVELGAGLDRAEDVAADVPRLDPAIRSLRRHDARDVLEALLLFEVRDEIIGSALDRLAKDCPDRDIADVLRAASQPIESNEAFGAHDSSRHRDRIAWLHDAQRHLVDAMLGLDVPRRWQPVVDGLLAPT